MGFIINPYLVQPSGDADAQAFITAAGITDSTQKSAIETLVTDLKGYGIWTKMKAIYPFVGGTATTHKYNLKDPQDTDAAFRLVFSGGWTHSSTGATPNGTNAYADTKLIPNSSLTNNNTHISFYSRTNNTNEQTVIGCIETSLVRMEWYLGTVYSSLYNVGSRISSAQSDARALWLGSRTNSSTHKFFKNGSQISTTNTSSSGDLTSITTRSIFLSAIKWSDGNVYGYSVQQCAFASIGDGLTDTEASNFYTAVQAFQTTLSRNV